MKEQLFNQLISRLSMELDNKSLDIVSRELVICLNDYEITKKKMEVYVQNCIPECVKYYLVTRKMEGLKQSTLDFYALRLKQFFQMVTIPIDNISANDIRLWLYNLQNNSVNKNGEHMSNRTLDCARIIICSFFKWANAEGYIKTNPCVNIKPIKYNIKERTPLTEEELELIRNNCDTIRNKAIIETLYSTGCRVSELINIKLNDIDLDNCEVVLFGKGGKYRKSYINVKAKIAILKYLSDRRVDSEYLFAPSVKNNKQNLSKDCIESIIRKIANNAGIERKVYPHLFRHTTASISLQRGMSIVEIQKMLGHESIETTMIYAKTSDNEVKANHRKYII